MSYSEITFNDRNPIKRWLQRRRLDTAVRLHRSGLNGCSILDFGAGNGELCKLLAKTKPHARIVCYEPTPSLLAEAQVNLASMPAVEFCSDVGSIQEKSIDLLFCLEVFEHLPPLETEKTLEQIDNLLSENGIAIVGVPVEIGIPAFYKGIFRMTRRFGSFDASPKNIILSVIGAPPARRPIKEIAPGLRFHSAHVGFDHRRLRKSLCNRFGLIRATSSPFSYLGAWLNPEIYFIVRRANPSVHR